MVIGFLLGSLNVFQYRGFIQGNFGWNFVGGICFSEKYSRVHGGFKLIIYKIYGVFIIENLKTKCILKMKKI